VLPVSPASVLVLHAWVTACQGHAATEHLADGGTCVMDKLVVEPCRCCFAEVFCVQHAPHMWLCYLLQCLHVDVYVACWALHRWLSSITATVWGASPLQDLASSLFTSLSDSLSTAGVCSMLVASPSAAQPARDMLPRQRNSRQRVPTQCRALQLLLYQVCSSVHRREGCASCCVLPFTCYVLPAWLCSGGQSPALCIVGTHHLSKTPASSLCPTEPCCSGSSGSFCCVGPTGIFWLCCLGHASCPGCCACMTLELWS
jgi:hypothetical protein